MLRDHTGGPSKQCELRRVGAQKNKRRGVRSYFRVRTTI